MGGISLILFIILVVKIASDCKKEYYISKCRKEAIAQGQKFFHDYSGNMRDVKTDEIVDRRWNEKDFVVVYRKTGRVRNLTEEKEIVRIIEEKEKYENSELKTAGIWKEFQDHYGDYCSGICGQRYVDYETGLLMVVREIDGFHFYMDLNGNLIRETDGQKYLDQKKRPPEEGIEKRKEKYKEIIDLFNETQKNRKGKVLNSEFFYNNLRNRDYPVELDLEPDDYFKAKEKKGN
jgi:hypothetical protein